MEVIFVRHGQTGGNVARRHQSDATHLTVAGILQIKEVSTQIAQLQPTHLLTSPIVRAIESASLIGAACKLIPQTNPIFIEIVRPQKLHGHFHKSIGSLFFYARWYFGLTHPEKDGGETYKALRERIATAQTALEAYPPDARIVVVSHSVFINFFVMHLCNKKRLSFLKTVWCFVRILTIPNAAVVRVRFDHSRAPQTCRWSVVR